MQALLSEDRGTVGSLNHRDDHGLLEGSLTVPFVNFEMDELGKLYVLVYLKGTEYIHTRTRTRTCLPLLDHM